MPTRTSELVVLAELFDRDASDTAEFLVEFVRDGGEAQREVVVNLSDEGVVEFGVETGFQLELFADCGVCRTGRGGGDASGRLLSIGAEVETETEGALAGDGRGVGAQVGDG